MPSVYMKEERLKGKALLQFYRGDVCKLEYSMQLRYQGKSVKTKCLITECFLKGTVRKMNLQVLYMFRLTVLVFTTLCLQYLSFLFLPVHNKLILNVV